MRPIFLVQMFNLEYNAMPLEFWHRFDRINNDTYIGQNLQIQNIFHCKVLRRADMVLQNFSCKDGHQRGVSKNV